MRYDPKIHSFTHLAKNILGRTESIIQGIGHPKNELLVLNFHGTQKKFLKEFEQKIDLLMKHFEIIPPKMINDYLAGTIKNERPLALITFDDGIKNNLLAAEILNKKNIKALFFVIPGFIATNETDQKDFFLRNIRPILNPMIDSQPEDLSAMSWNDLRSLLNLGHEIGSHTYTHTLVSANSDEKNSTFEIIDSKKEIEQKLGVSISSFCGPNNSLLSVGRKEMELIKQHYSLLYSTIPGTNTGKEPFFIRRSNVEAYWMMGTFLNAIGKWDRMRWEKKGSDFQNILYTPV